MRDDRFDFFFEPMFVAAFEQKCRDEINRGTMSAARHAQPNEFLRIQLTSRACRRFGASAPRSKTPAEACRLCPGPRERGLASLGVFGESLQYSGVWFRVPISRSNSLQHSVANFFSNVD